MGRLPFNPDDMAAARQAKAAPAESDKNITVSQLAGLIDRTLRDHLSQKLRVVGEIGQFRTRSHWYFDIKDAGAVVSCVMWQSAARKCGFEPRQGQQVVLTGRVEYYQPQGRTQFVVEKMEPVGVGALEIAFRKLVEELRGLGYFDDERKRPLPIFPRKVAIVTSRSAAALQDVLDTVARRCPSLELGLADVRVQGDGAAEQVARAIRAIGRHHEMLGIDVILVTRGGGSMEDLWAFNERVVADAIFDSPIPVVAAIGHETDTTIAELVADMRCATPTQAAMRIAPDREALREQLRSAGQRLGTMLRRQIRLDEQRLRTAERHSTFSDPTRVIEDREADLDSASKDLRTAALHGLQEARSRLDALAQRLERHRPEAVYAQREAKIAYVRRRLREAMHDRIACIDLDATLGKLSTATRHLLETRSAAVEAAARGLDLVGPHNVLKRGYSVTLAEDGTVMKSAANARPGQRVRTRLADGSFASVVTAEGADASGVREMPAIPVVRPPTRKGRAKPESRSQMDLFAP